MIDREQEYKDIIYHLVEFNEFSLSQAVKWMHMDLSIGHKPVDLVRSGQGDQVWEIIKQLNKKIPT